MERTLPLAPDATRSVARGHPWVYRSAVGSALTIPAGSVVRLVDPRGRFLARGLYDPRGEIAVRVLSRDPDERVDGGLVIRRIRAALQLRRRFVDGERCTGYRLVNGEGDRLPGLVVDLYGPVAVIRTYTPAWEVFLGTITDALVARATETVLRIEPPSRDPARRVDVLAGHAELPAELPFLDNGAVFVARPGVGQKTGFFLDQRDNRARVRRVAARARVLDLFANAGAFSVHAALGGAAHTTVVDISGGALADAEEHFARNGLEDFPRELVEEDAFGYLERCDQRYDLVIVDPPSLAHSQRSTDRARRKYGELMAAVSQVVEPGGTLVACSCTARVTPEAFLGAIREGLTRGRAALQVTGTFGHAADHPVLSSHPEGIYLKSVLGRVWPMDGS